MALLYNFSSDPTNFKGMLLTCNPFPTQMSARARLCPYHRSCNCWQEAKLRLHLKVPKLRQLLLCAQWKKFSRYRKSHFSGDKVDFSLSNQWFASEGVKHQSAIVGIRLGVTGVCRVDFASCFRNCSL